VIIRRFAALALTASLLHLSFVRADVACATHQTHSAEIASRHVSVDDSHHAENAHATPAGDHESACETPAQPDCCHAMVSCSPALGLTCKEVILTTDREPGSVVSFIVNGPLSRLIAPDPPPPKL
jgi:hypothetical protein